MLKKIFLNPLSLALILYGVVRLNKMRNWPRGLRNNNPLNIRHSNSAWIGASENQKDDAFVTFDSPQYGIRAAFIIISNYAKRYGLVSVRGIISRWAPSTENDTESYIKGVSRALGVSDTEILHSDHYPYLIAEMINHENGFNPYTLTFINESMKLT